MPSKKTTITQTGATVMLSYDEALTGERLTREFCIGGGYVYELREDGQTRQICTNLETRGSTLTAPAEGQTLIDLIRAEYLSMRAAEKRENSELGFGA